MLLAYRIWITDRNEPGVVRVLSRSAVEAKLLLRVLVDAAFLYTLTLFALLVCYAYQNTGHFIVLDMVRHPPFLGPKFQPRHDLVDTIAR